MFRKIALMAAAALMPMGSAVFVLASATPASAAIVKFDNSGDTVNCAGLAGKITITPALSGGGGPTATVIKVSGTLYGCTDGAGQMNAKNNPLSPPFVGKFAGTLAGDSSNITSLQGCGSDIGTLTVSWLATAGTEDVTVKGVTTTVTRPLLYTKTVVNVSSAWGATFVPTDAPYNTDHLTTDGYGSFSLGKLASDNGCAAATYTVPDAFNGSDSGTSSSTFAVTSQDFNAFIFNQENNATQTVSTINLGMGAAYFG